MINLICGIWCVYLKSNNKISCLVVALVTVVAVVVAMFNVIAYVAADIEHIQYMGFSLICMFLLLFFFAFLFVWPLSNAFFAHAELKKPTHQPLLYCSYTVSTKLALMMLFPTLSIDRTLSKDSKSLVITYNLDYVCKR